MNELTQCFNIFDDPDIIEFIAMKGKIVKTSSFEIYILFRQRVHEIILLELI